MAEYIEREAVLEIINSLNIASSLYAGRKIINLPSADVASVRHGRWVAVENEEQTCDEWDCTACGQRRTFLCEMDADDMKEHYPYCPNCGAKMDLEDNHDND